MRYLILILSSIFMITGANATDPLPADEAFRLSATSSNDGISFKWDIADGYYLYRNDTAAFQNGQDLVVTMPLGVQHNDPYFGNTEIYYKNATAEVKAARFGEVTLEFRGCQENGICYPIETKLIDPLTLAISSPANRYPVAPTVAAPIASEPLPEKPQKNDQGGIIGVFEGGNTLIIIASFLLFGILLGLTPCVFPMYPILAAALTREGERLTTARGFILSSIYVASLAVAFALFGAIAGLSGHNIQLALQSPYMTGAIAALFILLSMSMFGLFELQLPSKWTSAIQSKSNARGGKCSAAVLGFSSALLIGPCVTAPLAGALIFIAQTGNVALGAASLFALGIGKGVPLIILSTIGGSILPRAGAWMENIKRLFGFAFIATAIWMATPLLPLGIDLLLWGILLLAIAAFLFDDRWNSLNAKMLARTICATTAIYGTCLIIGFASGNTDPLKPLSNINGSGISQVPALHFSTVTTMSELSNEIGQGGKPSLVFFTADWCTTCHGIERRVLTDDSVKQALNGYNLIKVDLTHLNENNRKIMKELDVVGPPTMISFDKEGKESSRFIGDVTASMLVAATLK